MSSSTKTVKVRKEQDCMFCDTRILKGESAIRTKFIDNYFDDDFNEYRINNYSTYEHEGCLQRLEKAIRDKQAKCNHEFEEYQVLDHTIDGGRLRVGAPSGREYCEKCNLERECQT